MKNKWIYIAIFVLTICDAIFTTLGVKAGFIEEANPLIQFTFHATPEAAGAGIIVFVGAMLLLIYHYRQRIRWINYGLAAMAIVKLGVLGLHASWVSQII